MQSTYLTEPKPYRFFKVKNLEFYAHFHQQIEVVYCISGERKILINGLSYTLRSGDVAVIFPNRHHCYQPMEPEQDNEIYILLFYPSHIDSFYSEWVNMIPKEPIIRREQLPCFFSDLWEQFLIVHEANREFNMFKAYASVIAAHLMLRLELEPLRKSLSESGLQQEAMQAVLNYVNQHYTEKITLSSVAKELGYNSNSLSRMFSKTMGNNFMTHVNSLRISHAKKLLRSSNYSVGEISFLSGFQSKRTFFRNFQEMCGVTPSEYRENTKQ